MTKEFGGDTSRLFHTFAAVAATTPLTAVENFFGPSTPHKKKNTQKAS